MDKVISFIIPSRNNLKYLKQAYYSIRKNSSVEHEICIADDASTDGTMEQVLVWMKRDKNIKLHINKGPERLGHTILYDTLINDYATHDVVMIFHADMYLCPKSDEAIYKHLEPGKVVSLTRIEPPLHPDGPEKILEDFGIEPEEFKEQELLKKVTTLQLQHGTDYNFAKFTEGIFAPWAIYKKDFQSINGHDPLYAPQSKEDSDIFNRFVLAEYELIQTWEGFVYHMTCRGSRFKDGALRNPAGQVFMKGRESTEWLEQNLRSTRNFIRKWGHMVRHDEMMKPIIPPKYDVGFVVHNCNTQMLKEIEPWCSDIYGDWVGHKGYGVNGYIKEEQPNTKFDLSKKIHSQHIEPKNDVVVEFDCNLLSPQNFQIIVNLSDILKDSGEVGELALEIFKFKIKKLEDYSKDLINVI
jgi:glycosyltransferase involved in cell wall biosynthesis